MLENFHLILGSQSPRRKELLQGLGIPFETCVINTEEKYPSDLPLKTVPVFLAKQKANAYKNLTTENSLIITADTIVLLNNQIIGKPHSIIQAKEMLHKLSGETHHVITGVCITTRKKQKAFSVISEVEFANLTEEEINFYVEKYKPLDKAGAYGIQEWIGHIGVKRIKGSYFNVMGLPVQRLYQELKKF